MAKDNFDVIVIGSGFGGSVVASRLAEAGKSVLLLERGPWRDTLPVRKAGIKNRKPLPRSGGMLYALRSTRSPNGLKRGIRVNKYGFIEMWNGDGIKAPCGSSVGGGSHIWAALMEQAPDGFWNNRASGLSDKAMAQHYDRVLKELQATQPPDSSLIPNHTDHAWRDVDYFTPLKKGEQPPMGILYPETDGSREPVTDANGVTREPMDMLGDDGKFGSPGGAKSTVDALYLIPALKNGLEVRDMHEVRRISRKPDGTYELSVRNLRWYRSRMLSAPRIVVCAGTMNTNALLLTSRADGVLKDMPALGKGFGANGDLIGRWPTDGRDAVPGTPVHGRVKITGHEDAGYFIISSGETPPVPRFMRKKARLKAGSTLGVIATTKDASDGRIWLEDGRIRFRFDWKNSPSYVAAMRAMDALSEASGRKVKYSKDDVFTAHPMGGCGISNDAETGVVDGNGEVHGLPGLFVADGSVFPQSVGVSPSLSIAAWASHVAQQILSNN